MNNTENTKTKAIIDEELKQCEQVREQIAHQMKALGYGALLWGQNVFGTTNYPLISDSSGRTFNAHGIRLTERGDIFAIINYPQDEYITGVKSYTEQDAERFFTSSMLDGAGSPEEWSILGDCFSTALHVLKAEQRKDAPAPWW